MLTKATRAQILGSATFMLGAWPRGGAPICICTADLTGLSGADQERDGGWSVAGEGRVVWSWGPISLCQQTLFINCQLGPYRGTAKGWLPNFSLQDLPLPTPAGQGPGTLGSRKPSECVDRQNPSLKTVPQAHPSLHLAPRVSICGQRCGKRETPQSLLPVDRSHACAEYHPEVRGGSYCYPLGPARMASQREDRS